MTNAAPAPNPTDPATAPQDRTPRTKRPIRIGIALVTMLVSYWFFGWLGDTVRDSGPDRASTDTTQRDESGSVTSGGEVGVVVLRLGDCIAMSELTDTVAEVDHLDSVPCSGPHGGEVVLLDEGYFEGADLASTEERLVAAEAGCAQAVEDYTGQPYETSPYAAVPMVPTNAGWDAGDRSLKCVGFTLAEDGQRALETTGSIRAE